MNKSSKNLPPINIWMPDAVNISSQKDFDFEKIVFQTFEIKRFLNSEEGDNLYFLIGPKGSGKTHLLLCKSFLYHKFRSDYKFNTDSKQLVEYVTFPRESLSPEDLLKFQDAEIWKNIWTLCLMVVVVKSAEIEVSQQLQQKLDRFLGASSKVDSILWNIFNNRNQVRALVYLIGELSGYISNIRNGVAVFIDNVDQAFEDIIIEANKQHGTSTHLAIAAVEIWVNAQMGLIDAIFNLCTKNNYLKIFSTIRMEAFRIDTPRGRNYESHGIKLHYSKDGIRRILDNRLQAFNNNTFVDLTQKTYLGCFLGFEKIVHPFYKNSDGSVYEEDVFDYIYRHTFGRPREIIDIGLRLSMLVYDENYLVWDEKKRIDRVRDIVSEESSRFFNRYKQEIIPYFDENRFNDFVEKITNAVITPEEIKQFDTETLDIYYTFGLLGHAQNLPEGTIIKFRYFSQFEFGGYKRLPKSDYYFLHPALDRTLNEAKDYDFFYRKYLIGPDLPISSADALPSKNKNSPLYYYLPVNVSGDSWVNPGIKHREPLKEYYYYFFDRRPDVLKQIQNALEKEFRRNFTVIFMNFLAYSLFNKYGTIYQKAVEYTYSELRFAFPQTNVYQKQLPFIGNELDNARAHFRHRLYGRLITVGCCLFMDMNCSVIYRLLTTDEPVEFDQGAADNHDMQYRYLQNAFFIKGLAEFRNGNRHKEKANEHIFQFLSSHEQKQLIDWRNALSETLEELTWLQEEHREWVLGTLLSSIWRP